MSALAQRSFRKELGDARRHGSAKVVPVANLREFFRDSLQTALAHQRVAVEDQTEHYVVNMLTLFARSEALYDQHTGGHEAQAARGAAIRSARGASAGDRNRGLQRLGDVSLFVAGFFAQSFARKLIDIDYHIAMGGRAYGDARRSAGAWARPGAGTGIRGARARNSSRWSMRSMR